MIEWKDEYGDEHWEQWPESQSRSAPLSLASLRSPRHRFESARISSVRLASGRSVSIRIALARLASTRLARAKGIFPRLSSLSASRNIQYKDAPSKSGAKGYPCPGTFRRRSSQASTPSRSQVMCSEFATVLSQPLFVRYPQKVLNNDIHNARTCCLIGV